MVPGARTGCGPHLYVAICAEEPRQVCLRPPCVQAAHVQVVRRSLAKAYTQAQLVKRREAGGCQTLVEWQLGTASGPVLQSVPRHVALF